MGVIVGYHYGCPRLAQDCDGLLGDHRQSAVLQRFRKSVQDFFSSRRPSLRLRANLCHAELLGFQQAPIINNDNNNNSNNSKNSDNSNNNNNNNNNTNNNNNNNSVLLTYFPAYRRCWQHWDLLRPYRQESAAHVK